jgi:hypothetical protein
MAEFAQSACAGAEGELLKGPAPGVSTHWFSTSPTLIVVGHANSPRSNARNTVNDLLLGRIRATVKARREMS